MLYLYRHYKTGDYVAIKSPVTRRFHLLLDECLPRLVERVWVYEGAIANREFVRFRRDLSRHNHYVCLVDASFVSGWYSWYSDADMSIASALVYQARWYSHKGFGRDAALVYARSCYYQLDG